jgi:hypothetical protein
MRSREAESGAVVLDKACGVYTGGSSGSLVAHRVFFFVRRSPGCVFSTA